MAAEATEILEQNIQAGTGTHAHDRLPGRRQDRHDRRQHRRLVRRLHAAPHDRRLGRLSEGRHPDERPLLRRATSTAARSRPTSGATTWAASRATSAATSRRPSTRSSSSPFYGKYSKSGGSLTGGDRAGRRPTTATRPTPDDRRRRRRRTTGGAARRREQRRRQGFDPDQYESPPQPPPDDRAAARTRRHGGAAAPRRADRAPRARAGITPAVVSAVKAVEKHAGRQCPAAPLAHRYRQ